MRYSSNLFFFARCSRVFLAGWISNFMKITLLSSQLSSRIHFSVQSTIETKNFNTQIFDCDEHASQLLWFFQFSLNILWKWIKWTSNIDIILLLMLFRSCTYLADFFRMFVFSWCFLDSFFSRVSFLIFKIFLSRFKFHISTLVCLLSIHQVNESIFSMWLQMLWIQSFCTFLFTLVMRNSKGGKKCKSLLTLLFKWHLFSLAHVFRCVSIFFSCCCIAFLNIKHGPC